MYLRNRNSSSVLNTIGYYATVVLLAGIFWNDVALSSPLTRREDDDVQPDDPDSDVDTTPAAIFAGRFSIRKPDNYPSLDDCRNKVDPATDKSVFYSQVGKHEEKPQRFADSIQGVLLREGYPQGFTDKNDDWTGYPKFMQRASQAFAEKTSGTTHVLLPTDGKTDLSKRVWAKFEKPNLIRDEGPCNRIVKVDPDDFTKQCVLWDRGGKADDKLPNCNDENGPIPDKSSGPASPSSLKYAPGWCGLHVTQYQKNEPDSNPTGNYLLSITIFDAEQQQIGHVEKADAPSGQSVNLDSALPWVLITTAQNVDDDAVLFDYADQHWGSNDQEHHCNFGAYDSGKREGDCGFSC